MKKVIQKLKVKRRRTNFTLPAKAAQKVYLVGEFNQWNEKKHLMKKDADGTWKRTILLAPGRYEYKFLVDGKWKDDPTNSKRRQNRFGTYNSILQVD